MSTTSILRQWFGPFLSATKATTRPCVPSTTTMRSDHARITAMLPQSAPFSSSANLNARKKGAPKKDKRITEIRYHLMHPKTPRPLRFGRLRYLRHWTIHRAWQLFRRQHREARELELQRLYHSMRDACEELRHLDERGNRVPVSSATPTLVDEEGVEAVTDASVGTGKEVGRLYRKAMKKQDVWRGFPIEYSRPLTDYPSREGWNHGWKAA